MSYEIIQKPTFMNQLLALPQRELSHVLQKVQLLQEAPAPDAKNKKRLKGYKRAVYRIRAGNYRVVYSFDEQARWVVLLGVDDRKEVYEDDQLVAEAPGFDPGAVPDLDALLAPTPAPVATPEHVHQDDLPIQLDLELLGRLRLRDEHLPILLRCRTFDDLANADVPDLVRDRVFDAIADPNYDRVLQQPSFVTGDVDDLLRFAEGELLEFLLKLDPEQEKFVQWAVRGAGPTLVKGGPGTGKSTVALYRCRALLAALRQDGVAQPRLLFTTYTNALVNSSQQLLKRLLGADAALVTVRTADSLAREVVVAADGEPHLADEAALHAALQEALRTAVFDGNALQRKAQLQAVQALHPDYLLEELLSVIEARALPSLEAYLTLARAGRRLALNATQRTAVWRAYEAFGRALQRHGYTSWQAMRRRAAALGAEGRAGQRFDGVLIDEAQDLDPTVLRLLVALCTAPNRLFLAADANQSIYGSGFRWTDVHADLRFVGRTGVLRANYRSTREIGEAAQAYLRDGALDEPAEREERQYAASGPPPAVRAVPSPFDETELLTRFLRGASRAFRLGVGAGAVLVPSEKAGQAIAARLRDAGLEAAFMSGRQLDLERNVVKVLTTKSAKGLEFPVVAIAGLLDGPMPGAPRGSSGEAAAEALARERRTMYVAMTRAMRALLVSIPIGARSPLCSGFDPQYWNTGTAAAL